MINCFVVMGVCTEHINVDENGFAQPKSLEWFEPNLVQGLAVDYRSPFDIKMDHSRREVDILPVFGGSRRMGCHCRGV